MNEYSTLSHYFNVGVACEYGLNEAIILQNIFFWVTKNAANGVHFHDGRYWTYNSAPAFTKLFPYFTKRQIQYALKKLEEHGLILVGNYNKQRFDQTRWYALTDKAYELFGQVVPQVTNSSDGNDNIGNSKLQICQMDNTRLSHVMSQNRDMDGTMVSHRENNHVTPIPDRNTDGISDGNGTHENSYSCGGNGNAVIAAGATVDRTRRNTPTIDEVREFVHRKGLHVDADRFFEVNTIQGWVTKDGTPVDDWKRYLLTWERHEKTSPALAHPQDSAPIVSDAAGTAVPSVEKVMERCLCDRATAEELIRERLV